MLKEITKKWIPLVALLLLVASLFGLSASAATTLTLLDGGLTITDSVGTGIGSGGKVTITATGGSLSKTTNTITMVNETDYTATLSFVYTVSNADSHTLPAESGTYTAILDAGASTSFTITSKRFKGVVTLTMSNISLVKAAEASNVTFNFDSSLGSVTVDEIAVENGDIREIPLSGATLNATPNTGVTFLGWIDGGNKRLNTATTHTLAPTENMTVQAVFIDSASVAWFLVPDGGDMYLYSSLTKACEKATSTSEKRVILANDGTLATGEYTIPAGVTLLIPFDASHTLYTTEPGTTGTTYTSPSVFRKLTMASGASITVNGSISVSAKCKEGAGGTTDTGAPSGPYGQIHMSANSSITVNANGALYAWGYITGSGSVTAKSDAKVYELFQFQDWRGGDATTSMKNGVLPISQFYIQNIEVPLTYEAGSRGYAYTAVNVKILGKQPAKPQLFGSSSDSDVLFKIISGSFTKRYDNATDRIIFTIDGEIQINNLKISMGIYSIDSADYNLCLNGNSTIEIAEGSKVTINNNMALIPGTEINIAQNAELIIGSSANIYIYDLDEWGNFCGAYDQVVIPITYTPSTRYKRTASDLKDVSIDVNGTITINGFAYTTLSGANIFCTEGTGVIKVVQNGTATETYQYDQSESAYIAIGVNPLWLKNLDGSYTKTKREDGLVGTYTYIDGYWHLTYQSDGTGYCSGEVVVTEKAATCTEPGSKITNCTCGVAYATVVIPAKGHTEESIPAVAPTCTETGLTEGKKCTGCGTVTVAQTEVPAKGHTEVIDAAVDATCTATGLTEGKHCSVCGTVTVAQTEVPALGHSYESVVTEPTCTEAGNTTYTCSGCGDIYIEEVAKLGHSWSEWVGNSTTFTTTCSNGCEDKVVLTLEYRLNDYIWLNAIVSGPENVALAENTYGYTFQQVNEAYYLVRKVHAKEIPDAFTVTFTALEAQTPALRIGFATYKDILEKLETTSDVTKTLLTKMEAYGEAAYIYFTSSEKTTYNDDDTKTAPTLTMGTDVDKEMSITVDPATDVEGVTLKTNSARVYFDEALRMSVFFTPTGFDNSKIVKIGLLATPGTGELTVSNHETMYVLYSKTKPEILGGSENYPDAEIKDEVNGTVKVDDAAVVYGSLATVDGRWEVCFDLTNDMYSKAYELRPFVLLDDGSYVYGDQVHYSLAAYISRTYENADKAFKNLLVATWDYVVAADAAF